MSREHAPVSGSIVKCSVYLRFVVVVAVDVLDRVVRSRSNRRQLLEESAKYDPTIATAVKRIIKMERMLGITSSPKCSATGNAKGENEHVSSYSSQLILIQYLRDLAQEQAADLGILNQTVPDRATVHDAGLVQVLLKHFQYCDTGSCCC